MTPARIRVYEPSPRWICFQLVPRWIFYFFTRNWTKLSRFVHKSNIEHDLNNISKNRLQSATKKEGLH